MRQAQRPEHAFEVRHDPEPRPAQQAEAGPQVRYSGGRAYLNEASVGVPKFGVTPDDLKAMRMQQLADAAYRQARKDANLAAALRVGGALKVLRGEDD